MIDFVKVDNKTIQCKIDGEIFNERVVFKSLYWFSGDYNIYSVLSDKLVILKIEKKKGLFTDNDVNELRSNLNQSLIDFKTRDVINQETKNIREILLIKAFSNNDEFEDYNLITNE